MSLASFNVGNLAQAFNAIYTQGRSGKAFSAVLSVHFYTDRFLIRNFVFPKRNIPLANPLDLCYNISVKLKKWKVCYDRKL